VVLLGLFRDQSLLKKRHSFCAGDETLRSLLVVGATSVIQKVRRGTSRSASPWLLALLARKPPKLAAVALANKVARIAWKLMVSGVRYDPGRLAAAPATN